MSFLKNIDSPKKRIALRLGIVLLGVLVIFGGIHFTWKLGYVSQYEKIAEKLDVVYLDETEEEDMKRYGKTFGEYSVLLKMPAYLGYGGFITVGSETGYIGELDESGNITGGSGLDISLYIWPKLFGGYTLGLDFLDDYNNIWEQVYVNRDLSLSDTEDMDDDYIDYINKLIQDNYSEIENLFNVAEKELGLPLS